MTSFCVIINTMDQLEIQEDGSEQQEKEKKLQQRSLEFFSEKLQAIVDEAKSKSILNLKHSMRNDKDSCFEPDAYTTVKAIISIAGSIPGAKDLTDATDQIVDAFRGVKQRFHLKC